MLTYRCNGFTRRVVAPATPQEIEDAYARWLDGYVEFRERLVSLGYGESTADSVVMARQHLDQWVLACGYLETRKGGER